jgi:tripartite-type tricarboxylate transporter receptor subunit TctC
MEWTGIRGIRTRGIQDVHGVHRAHRHPAPLPFAHLGRALVAAAAVLSAQAAFAQGAGFPNRTLTIIVPYGPGSANDILARMLGPEVSAQLKQPVVVENKPGAGGSIGTVAIARARNDGYTIGLAGSATFGVNPAMQANLPYAVSDFSAVIKLASTANVLVVPAQSKVTDAQDFLANLKSRVMRYNSLGNGTTAHLAGALVARKVNATADHIPYKNAGEMVTALISAQVDFAFQPLPAVLNQIKDGRLRALGVSNAAAPKALPGVPSLNAALSAVGLKDFEKANVWFGMVAPKDTPREVLLILNRAFAAALSRPEILDKLSGSGYDVDPPAGPEAFDQFVQDQRSFWAELVRFSGAKAE